MADSGLAAVTQLYDLTTRLVGEIGLGSLFREIGAAAIALLKADFATIELCDAASGQLTLVAQSGPVQPSVEYVHRMGLASDREDSLRSRTPVHVKVESLFDGRESTPHAVASGARISTPLFAREGRPLGVIATHYFKAPAPAAPELQLFDLYCRHAASVIERDRSWQALRASEGRLRRHFDLGLIGMAVISPARQLIEANDELCRVLGYERNEIVGLMWADMIAPDDWPAQAFQLERALAGEIDSYSIDTRCMRKDGVILHTSVAARCVRHADGSPDYLLAVVQDITERKLAEDELRC